MYKVYKIDSVVCYFGFSLVSANNAIEANKFIEEFKKEDIGNRYNSFGYSFVDESDILEGIFSNEKGIVHYGICYGG